MYCVKPALQKKPSRGFAWSCAACSRAQERKLEARHTPNIVDGVPVVDAEEEEYVEEEDDLKADTGRTTPTAGEYHHPPPTEEQKYQASLWPYRYFGMHCKLEDALDLDDRVFPRASTRLGTRHQANVLPWPGRPVEYVKPVEIKRGRKDGKITKETQAAIEAEKKRREHQPWIQDEPAGWVERGGDDTVDVLWRPPHDAGVAMAHGEVTKYMDTAQQLATSLDLPSRSTNLATVALGLLYKNEYDPEKAIEALPKLDKAEFKEPSLTPAEQKKFEEAVTKYGSELHSVKKHIKTVKPGPLVRYYYTWKKTEKGKQIWSNFAGRKGKKDARRAEKAANKLADDVADEHDDSAFDNGKAAQKKRQFVCKFCGAKKSRQWRRAPAYLINGAAETNGRNGNKDKNIQYVQALCRRCAEPWRRYAIQWEDRDEVAKKIAQTGGRWRRNEDYIHELELADMLASNTLALVDIDPSPRQEPPRKKLKSGATMPDKDVDMIGSDSGSGSGPATVASKKKAKPKPAPVPPPPPAVPQVRKPRVLPCAVCHQKEPMGDQLLACKECRMSVHRSCYGVVDNRAPGKWTCDMCVNDKTPQVSIVRCLGFLVSLGECH
jgi:hypothetical protein